MVHGMEWNGTGGSDGWHGMVWGLGAVRIDSTLLVQHSSKYSFERGKNLGAGKLGEQRNR